MDGLAELKQDVKWIKESVAKLNEILIEGNGRDSIITRVTILETQVQKKERRWGTVVALIIALLSAVGSAISNILRH